ncbi:glycosyltransferase [Actinomadura fulvescens]|uniref:Glycosyltransferase n=1 Tax=Actinomadura fulvescens TaxID=46160 RepID=A0ABN3PFX4_9ACTN
MRFLFVVPPLAGHVNPTIAVANELGVRGHEVAWCGPGEVLAWLLPPNARIHPAGKDGDLGALHLRWGHLRGVAALKFLWEEALVPLARDMVPGVAAAVEAFRPDVVIADQQAFAGGIVARERGLPWATSATTSAEFTRPFRGFPKIGQWVRERLDGLLGEFGAGTGWDPRFADDLVIIFSTPVLVGEGGFPAHYLFVGPALGSRASVVAAPDFPWERLAPGRRRILVSLGTLNGQAGARFYPAVMEATEDLDVQVVLAAPAELTGTVPRHVLVQEHVPQLLLLPHLNAVVSHGGHNTVCESLAHGLPLVVAPIRDDQPIIADQVVAAGAGVRVRFGRARVPELREAIGAVLDEPRYRAGARRVQASFAAAGGAAAAADRLEGLTSPPFQRGARCRDRSA